jgi:hypothetical protein
MLERRSNVACVPFPRGTGAKRLGLGFVEISVFFEIVYIPEVTGSNKRHQHRVSTLCQGQLTGSFPDCRGRLHPIPGYGTPCTGLAAFPYQLAKFLLQAGNGQ